MKSIKDDSLHLPTPVPVMVLPGTLLFPNSLLPLHIFEPRYRTMLECALETNRMFCIALVRPGLADWSAPADFFHVAGLGLVRACVGREDGTSDLILQGLTRVEFIGFPQETPFIVADIRELPSTPAANFEADDLTAKLLGFCAQLRANGMDVPESLDEQLARIDNPDMLADIVAHTFLRDPFRRQEVFEELRVGERLRLLLRHLSAEML